MADSKVSDLTAASSASSSDLLYLVQSGTSKKITVANLLNSAANANLSSRITISGQETLDAGGTVSTSVPITLLSGGGILSNLGIANGNNGQIKIITFNTTTGGSFELNTGNIAGNATVQFKREGDSALLIFLQTHWHVIGGTANVIYS